MSEDLIERARAFATSAHEDQQRKYTGESYIHHPVAVAKLVATRPHTPEMIVAALLHDTIEDCGVTLDTIQLEFGDTVASLVDALTDVSRPADGNRSARKALDRAHIAAACPDAKTVKLADLIDNSRSILEHDLDFAVVYMKEKALLLEALRDGDPVLWQMAFQIVRGHEEERVQKALLR